MSLLESSLKNVWTKPLKSGTVNLLMVWSVIIRRLLVK